MVLTAPFLEIAGTNNRMIDYKLHSVVWNTIFTLYTVNTHSINIPTHV